MQKLLRLEWFRSGDLLNQLQLVIACPCHLEGKRMISMLRPVPHDIRNKCNKTGVGKGNECKKYSCGCGGPGASPVGTIAPLL